MNATIEQIQNDLEGYLHRVRDGETVVVFEGDEAVAELRPIPSSLPVQNRELLRQQRLEREARKLDPSEEQAMAEERYGGEVDWPEY
jgi:antitoxin (DNA-binding transcriptional repressor) of toxin-antitoxin stability system